MTDEERRQLLDDIERLVDRLRDGSYGPDLEIGRVVWPPTEEMSHDDAITTLFDIRDCDLDLTLYDETGNALTDEWVVTFNGTQAFPDSPGWYARRPLKAMIEDELKHWDPDKVPTSPRGRILLRLLAAFDEPETCGKNSLTA
jgi:hypothetical protein